MIISNVGRNDPCPCGSGKKYKKCCGNLAKKKPKQLSMLGLHKLFTKIIKDNYEGKYDISCDDLDSIPMDEALAVKHDSETDVFHLEVVKVKKQTILTPDKRIRINK